jgi:hypothetical protein
LNIEEGRLINGRKKRGMEYRRMKTDKWNWNVEKRMGIWEGRLINGK